MSTLQHDRNTCDEGLECPRCYPKVNPNMTLPQALKRAHEARQQPTPASVWATQLSVLFEARDALRAALDDNDVLNPDGSRRPLSDETLERIQAALTVINELG